MHDITGDLQARAERLKQQIGAENTRFETLLRQLQTKRETGLEHLRAQLRLANKLIEFTCWHDRLRAELGARIAAAEAAEVLIRKSSQPEC
jgi:very-short-patch-repair endonuclease